MTRLIFAVLALAVSCASPRRSNAPALVLAFDTPLDDTLRVPLGGVAQTHDNTVRVAIRSRLSDSRCAANVQCVWAGSVGVGLRVETGHGADEGNVHTNAEPRILWAGQHQVSLLDVTPRPGEPKAPVVATVRVVRLGK